MTQTVSTRNTFQV